MSLLVSEDCCSFGLLFSSHVFVLVFFKLNYAFFVHNNLFCNDYSDLFKLLVLLFILL